MSLGLSLLKFLLTNNQNMETPSETFTSTFHPDFFWEVVEAAIASPIETGSPKTDPIETDSTIHSDFFSEEFDAVIACSSEIGSPKMGSIEVDLANCTPRRLTSKSDLSPRDTIINHTEPEADGPTIEPRKLSSSYDQPVGEDSPTTSAADGCTDTDQANTDVQAPAEDEAVAQDEGQDPEPPLRRSARTRRSPQLLGSWLLY